MAYLSPDDLKPLTEGDGNTADRNKQVFSLLLGCLFSVPIKSCHLLSILHFGWREALIYLVISSVYFEFSKRWFSEAESGLNFWPCSSKHNSNFSLMSCLAVYLICIARVRVQNNRSKINYTALQHHSHPRRYPPWLHGDGLFKPLLLFFFTLHHCNDLCHRRSHHHHRRHPPQRPLVENI